MNQIFVIGIGPGGVDQLTVQATRALASVDVFFVLDKGDATADLVAVRSEMIRLYAGRHRVVDIPEVPRDRQPADYAAAVLTWHDARAAVYETALAQLAPGEVGAFLVWGDPALYDSTLRILDRLPVEITVIPGVTSVAALTAAHRIVLHRIGESVHITTGRRLLAEWGPELNDVVVMLDSHLTCLQIAESGLDIYWGAYLGTADEALLSGSLAEVGAELAILRAELKQRKGWIMDTYLIRRR
ncbi:precorrin-6A synthase (deacetylating) [Nakamurella antarctica]|uniref:Precorrin-6A synthase (Deacetylating) n=1 Tax=Nakamurella antarctica TaxID=1902245 RepID=A0A3G8ZNV6_9ACTN|nr:precorrin-6A synthase (deacetylating) [Nakamurella antarctica]AZI59022.1 precorrin-6A synthase (deacetylating) [Nakamurella antarctica]